MKRIFNFKRIFFIVFFIYAIYSFAVQQKQLNSYAAESKQYTNDISTAEESQNELNDTLQNLNSTNYIEGIARDKLDMYLPNERVYIDIAK